MAVGPRLSTPATQIAVTIYLIFQHLIHREDIHTVYRRVRHGQMSGREGRRTSPELPTVSELGRPLSQAEKRFERREVRARRDAAAPGVPIA